MSLEYLIENVQKKYCVLRSVRVITFFMWICHLKYNPLHLFPFPTHHSLHLFPFPTPTPPLMWRAGSDFAFLGIICFMIPKSNYISGCIQVNLTFFLVSSTLTPPSSYAFFLVLYLSFIALFLLENLSERVHISTVLPFLHRASIPRTLLCTVVFLLR